MWDYACSRPLCALLPRFAALSRLALTGYNIDIGGGGKALLAHALQVPGGGEILQLFGL